MSTALIRRDPALIQLTSATRALAKASTIPEVKAIRDAAEAAEVYARRRQLGAEAEDLAYKIKILALAKLGDLLKAAKAAGDLNEGTARTGGPGRGHKRGSATAPRFRDPRPTLASLKIDKKLSMQAQQLASLPMKTREAIADRDQALSPALTAARGRRHPSDAGDDIREVKKELTSEWVRAFTFTVNAKEVQQQLADLYAHFNHRDRAETARRIVAEAHKVCRR
jgi:hypothetical protein